ncbi:alkaline phosphatase family protein [Kitasatospora fiedleri]|uniref:alkaline phosphatase family protein n=1 Tax=Kitasatospora fiedleri TaxID=2991545 RepID=UPI002989FE4E|nr:alkaline phosphatase family protein [Kitasatospora fiedleri]
MIRKPVIASLLAGALALVGSVLAVDTGFSGTTTASAAAAVPRPDHVVIVLFENKDYSTIIGSANAPYVNSLAAQGASFTQSYGVTHPSQPNYLALFSGSQQGVTDDSCPKNFTGTANLGSQLLSAGYTFKGYSEALPSTGYTGCSSGTYQRKHAPWVDFDNVPGANSVPFSTFPTDYGKLPTVSFVTPDMCNDMHDCAVGTGDTWLKNNLDGYAQWAKTHNSLLIATFDEDNFSSVNQIATVMVGEKVRPGAYAEQINHYSVLRTLEDAYGLAPLGSAAGATPITDVWTTSPPPTATPSPTGPASPSPSPTPVPGLVNGGFEYGTFTGWTRTGTTAIAAAPHSGAYAAAVGSTSPTDGDSVLTQTFTAPPGVTKLTLWWKGDCKDTVAYAWATVVVKHNTSGSTSTPLPKTCTANGSWQQVTDKLTPGHSYTVQLVSHDDNHPGDPNITWFDDLTLS